MHETIPAKQSTLSIFRFPRFWINDQKNEKCTECPPFKQMKFDSKATFENDKLNLNSTFKTENYYKFQNNMQKGKNLCTDEEEDEFCVNNEAFGKKWGSSNMMARQSIHENKSSLNFPPPFDKRKAESSSNTDKVKKYKEYNTCEIQVVKYVSKNSDQNPTKNNKSKAVSSRILNTCPTSSMRQNVEKCKSTFPSVKKSIHFLQESYRLSEKLQYLQLLQQQTHKFNSLLDPFTIQKIGYQSKKKPSIPVIDLTKEKNDVVVNRSREHIPWTSSWAKSNQDALGLEAGSSNKEVTKVNSLQDMLKTYSVTEVGVVDEILSKHATETAEKRRQAEIEAAKLKILSASNKKAFSDALEEKLRQYMRITTPVLEELEPTKEKYLLPLLNQEQEAKISYVLKPSPPGEILVEKFGLQIKRRDLQTLKGLNWLNDEVINFYMNLIMERGKNGKLPTVYAFNTFFYPKLASSGHASLKRWTKKVDIFSHDLILVPIHLGMHWCMSVIDFRSKEVRYYDSMGSSNSRCLRNLLSYLEAESLDKKKVSFDTKGWKEIDVEDIPHQMNGSDCGVFSCMFAEHVARNSPLSFSQDQMPYFRRKMALEIVEAKLLT